MARKGRVVVMGAGPAGMAAALSIAQTEHDVIMLERYPAARPAGTSRSSGRRPSRPSGCSASTPSTLAHRASRSSACLWKVRAVVHLPQDVVDQYGGGFIGMLRPQLYSRMLDSIPDGILRTDTQVSSFDQDKPAWPPPGGRQHPRSRPRGADGIDSLVRRTLWGDARKREHNLHIIGGFTFDDTLDVPTGGVSSRTPAPSRAAAISIRHEGRAGFQWWVLGAFDSSKEFTGDLHATARGWPRGSRSPCRS